MKPIDLYTKKPSKISYDLSVLKGVYYDHIKELNEQEVFTIYHDLTEKNKHVSIHYYADEMIDHKRVWILASVWYRDTPVMVIQNAGRDGDDHAKRFITNEELYYSMLQYIASLLPNEEVNPEDVVDAKMDIENLTAFHSQSLEIIKSIY